MRTRPRGIEFVPNDLATKNSMPNEAAPIDGAPVPLPARAGRHRFARALAMVLLGLSLGACSGFNLFNKDDTPPDEAADRLYNEGLFLLNVKKDPKEAAKKFEEVDRQHPYSEWARKSLIMTSYSYYQANAYDDCVTAAQRYITLHPGSPDAAYAQYLIGASNFEEIPDITRDQTAGKEMETGRYYLDKKDYTGAINRFKVVVTKYQTTRHVEEALMRLTEAYMALGIVEEAQTAAAVLGHNFPDSPWYRHAYQLVTSGGAVPNENQGSWISKAFRKVGLG